MINSTFYIALSILLTSWLSTLLTSAIILLYLIFNIKNRYQLAQLFVANLCLFIGIYFASSNLLALWSLCSNNIIEYIMNLDTITDWITSFIFGFGLIIGTYKWANICLKHVS